MQLPSKETQWNICNWFYGLITLLIALAFLPHSPGAGLAAIAAALLVIPPVRRFAHSKTGKALPQKARVVLYVALLVASLSLLAQAQEANKVRQAEEQRQALITEYTDGRASHLDAISKLLSKGNYLEALNYGSKYASIIEDADLDALMLQAREQELIAKTKATSPDDYSGQLAIYKELMEIHPDEALYKEKARIFARKTKEAEAKEARRKRIEANFSAWDGSHYGVEQYIKASMNDPDSYEHVKTIYWDKGDYLIVETTFRGKNGFGAVVLGKVTAKVDLDGNFLERLG